ncbi:dihydropteroate synthase [Nitrospirillum amazonense]|uniref:dihydropteroate synthase n=1 Tax=Nitrospirillum amazonense TaxID=28077 RepID=A0A560JVJ0_9PROT|nr:dihydropteroate synthase [Nitrospirillum amazonense]TWB73534.1 dihydropteroate synthase [Nitrospirillum amazonense]
MPSDLPSVSLDPWASGAPVAAEGVYLTPVGLLSGLHAPDGHPLAGTALSFTQVEVAVRRPDAVARKVMEPRDLVAWAATAGVGEAVGRRLAALSAPRPAFAGLDLSRPLVMGIVNVTPDSFSDGGDFAAADAAIAHGQALMAAGADILDIGGESTRPGAAPVSPEEEAARVVPVIRALAAAGAVISVDTRHAPVMAAALDAGARIINDISALEGDPDSLALVAARGCPVVLMHMQGDPRTMQLEPRYADAALDVMDYLLARVEACVAAGIPRARIAVDPGIGFGKTVEHNLDILRHTALYHGTGCALLVGLSRKRFLAALSRGEAPKDRVAGSLAAGLACLDRGAHILRVHDVAETVQARALWQALNGFDI